jgi:predicted metal-dependent phosphoesterase TrpH
MDNRPIDLHIHSSYSSDGESPPARLVEIASDAGLAAIALTDHDTVEGLGEFTEAGTRLGVETVPGVELTVNHNGGYLHVLGYFIRHDSGPMTEMINRLTEARFKQTAGRIARLRELGLVVDEGRITYHARGLPPVGPVIGMAVLERIENRDHPLLAELYVGPKADAPYFHFDRDLLAEGKPAYVPVERPAPAEAVDVIWRSDGIPVLAHPGEQFSLPEDRGKLNAVIDTGIAGLEVYCSYHNDEQEKAFGELADELGLVKTAGSDYHGSPVKPYIKMGQISHNPYTLLEKLRDRRRKGR